MTPPRCNHPCAPRSASSVYCLLTIPLLRLGLLDPLTDSTSIASIQDHSNAVHGPLQPGFCREQHHRSAHSACALHPGVADRRRPIGPPICRKRSEQRRKVGRQSTISRGNFAIKTGRDMSEGGVTTGKNRSTATKTCWRRKMALTAAQTMARSSLPPKNCHFLPT